MKNFWKILIILSVSVLKINAKNVTTPLQKESLLSNQVKIEFLLDKKVNEVYFKLSKTDNVSLKIVTLNKSYLYKIPKLINKNEDLSIKLEINDIKEIIFNNIKREEFSILEEVKNVSSCKIWLLIKEKEYLINFNLQKDSFPIIGFISKQKIIKPTIRELKSNKEIQKIIPANITKYTSLKNEIDTIDYIEKDTIINEIGFVNIHDYYDLNKPIKSDLKMILHFKKKDFRRTDFEFFNLISDPKIFVIKYNSLLTQSLGLKRLAFFVEKKDFRNQVLTNEELKNKIGWNGHDYKVTDMVNFFNQAAKEKVKLNKEEIILKNILILNNLAYFENNALTINKEAEKSAFAFYAKDISLSDEKSIVLLTHEILHMFYFTDDNFALKVKNFWNNNVTMHDKKVWKRFLEDKNYDTKFMYLLINEFYAYVMQRPKEALADYLINSGYFKKNGKTRYSNWASQLEKILFQSKGLIAGELLILFLD